MKVIGVTGGVGAGKSEVLGYIAEHWNATVVEADEVGYLVMRPGKACYSAIVDLFGTEIVKEDQTLDRELIAKIVFENKEMLAKMNGIVHPAVKEYIKKAIKREEENETNIFIVEAALLIEDKYDEICDWYDGYRFGSAEIFNPWSVINYFNNGCQPKAFWLSTGSNDIIGELLEEADQDTYDKLTSLVSGKTIVSYIDTDVIYPQIKQNPSAIYSFLLVAGYLNAVKVDSSFGIDSICELALPNKEISFVYNKEILQKLNRIIPQSIAVSVQEAIYSGDSKRIQELIHNLLLQSASSFDTAGENFYHGFMLGLCAMLSGAYTTSNRESGEGRYDIQMMPKRANLPGILIELKAGKKCTEETLKLLSETALQQINDRQYDTEMLSKGVSTIYKYGVAFSGKSVSVTVG